MVTCFARVISAGLPNAICRRTWRKTRWPAGDDDGDGDGDGDDDGDDDGAANDDYCDDSVAGDFCDDDNLSLGHLPFLH